MHEKGKSAFAGVVLAAGRSTRFEGRNKLLAEVRGVPLVRRTALVYLEAGLDQVVVVTGHDSDEVTSALSGLPVHCRFNARYAEGQSTSLHTGIRAISHGVTAVVIGVADQLYLTSDTIERLMQALRPRGDTIVVPRYGGQRGNPVVFPAVLLPELLHVTGDVGGRPVIEHHIDRVTWVDFDHAYLGADVDQPADLPGESKPPL